jgi:hypothetical protein
MIVDQEGGNILIAVLLKRKWVAGYDRDMRFIIETTINLITDLQTCGYCQEQSIAQFIV